MLFQSFDSKIVVKGKPKNRIKGTINTDILYTENLKF